MASIYNNIGNIHLLGERYEEAIDNYKLSVESSCFFLPLMREKLVTDEELKKTAKIQKMIKQTPGSKTGKISLGESKGSAKGSGNTRYSNLKQSLKNDFKVLNTEQRDSKGSTLNLASPTENKAIFETQIANREYQLVNALILQSEKKKVNNWEEAIRRLNRVLRVDLEYKQNGSRIIKTHLMISNALLGRENFRKNAHFYRNR